MIDPEMTRIVLEAARYAEHLSHDETVALRGVAEACDLDPDLYTPDYRAAEFPHAFKALTDSGDVDQVFGIRRVVAVQGPDGWTTVRNDDEQAPYVPCGVWRCGKPEDDPIHKAAEDERLSA